MCYLGSISGAGEQILLLYFKDFVTAFNGQMRVWYHVIRIRIRIAYTKSEETLSINQLV